MSNGLPPTNTWVAAEPCATDGDGLVSSIDNITITGAPGAITSVANDQSIWSIVLNDGTSSSQFRIDRYVGGTFIDSPIIIANANGAVTLTMDPTAPLGIATKEYVDSKVAGVPIGVASFNTRAGAVTLSSADVTGALTFTPYNATNPAGYQTAAQISTSLAGYLPLSGGVMAGVLGVPAVTNMTIGGGATGQVLTTNGSGALSWSTPSGTFIDAPSNSQYYSRYNGGWAVSPGGLVDAPNDGTSYARKSQAWSHLSHADITDWSAVLSGYATTGSVPAASTTTPVMDGTAAVGTGTTWARADHVHPTDTTRAAQTSLASYLPLIGGTLTGPLNGTAASFSGNINGLNVSAGVGGAGALYPTATLDATFLLNGSGTGRQLQFTTGYSIVADKTPLTIAVNVGGGLAATFSNAGNLTITGATATKASGTAWANPSDMRIKTVEGEYKSGLDEVLKLEPILYRYKGNASATKDSEAFPKASITAHVGFVAQAVETVMPEMVTAGAGVIDGVEVDDLRSLDTGPLIFALVNAVKTLAARVSELEAARG